MFLICLFLQSSILYCSTESLDSISEDLTLLFLAHNGLAKENLTVLPWKYLGIYDEKKLDPVNVALCELDMRLDFLQGMEPLTQEKFEFGEFKELSKRSKDFFDEIYLKIQRVLPQEYDEVFEEFKENESFKHILNYHANNLGWFDNKKTSERFDIPINTELLVKEFRKCFEIFNLTKRLDYYEAHFAKNMRESLKQANFPPEIILIVDDYVGATENVPRENEFVLKLLPMIRYNFDKKIIEVQGYSNTSSTLSDTCLCAIL